MQGKLCVGAVRGRSVQREDSRELVVPLNVAQAEHEVAPARLLYHHAYGHAVFHAVDERAVLVPLRRAALLGLLRTVVEEPRAVWAPDHGLVLVARPSRGIDGDGVGAPVVPAARDVRDGGDMYPALCGDLYGQALGCVLAAGESGDDLALHALIPRPCRPELRWCHGRRILQGELLELALVRMRQLGGHARNHLGNTIPR